MPRVGDRRIIPGGHRSGPPPTDIPADRVFLQILHINQAAKDKVNLAERSGYVITEENVWQTNWVEEYTAGGSYPNYWRHLHRIWRRVAKKFIWVDRFEQVHVIFAAGDGQWSHRMYRPRLRRRAGRSATVRAFGH